jgi:hypothetical protein
MKAVPQWTSREWLAQIHARCQVRGECWVWPGSVTRHGAPRWNAAQGLEVRVHRQAWAMSRGPIPRGHVLVNTCGEPRCCRSAHYECIPKAEQMRRELAAGRGAQGALLGLAVSRSWRRRADLKMSLERAAAMRARREQEPRPTLLALAQEFGVSKATAALVVRGQRWVGPSPWVGLGAR